MNDSIFLQAGLFGLTILLAILIKAVFNNKK